MIKLSEPWRSMLKEAVAETKTRYRFYPKMSEEAIFEHFLGLLNGISIAALYLETPRHKNKYIRSRYKRMIVKKAHSISTGFDASTSSAS